MACCLSRNSDTPSWEKGSSLQAPSWVEKRRRRLQQHEMKLRPWVSCSQPASSQQASSQQLPASPPACHLSRIRGLQRAVEPSPTCGLCGRELLQQQQQPPVTPSRPDPFFALQCTEPDNLWSVCVSGPPRQGCAASILPPRVHDRGIGRIGLRPVQMQGELDDATGLPSNPGSPPGINLRSLLSTCAYLYLEG